MSSYVIRILSNRSIISDTSIGSFHQPLSSAESVVRCGDISDIRSGNGRENKDNNQPTASSQSQGGKYFTSGGFCDRLHSTTCTLIFELCCGCKPSQLLEGVWKRFQWISESDLTKGKYLGNIFSLHSKYILPSFLAGGFLVAQLVRMEREPSHCPFIRAIAFSASTFFMKDTNP